MCVVVTARPSYSRVRSVLQALQARPDVELSVIACASALVTRFGRVADEIRRDGFPLASEISSLVEDDTLANSALSTGVLLTQLAGTLERLSPDVVVTIADRHETLATAIAASYQHILLCHIQGGEVTGSIDDKVRNAVTQLADAHCVATPKAAIRVARMKRYSAGVEITGCPSLDVAAEAVRLGPARVEGRPLVVLQHAVTSEAHAAGLQMQATVDALAGLDNVVWFWPGEDAGSQAMSKVLRLAGIHPVRNMPPLDFLRLLLASRGLVGNSSVGIRECSFLGVPVVNVGTRQMGRERAGNVVDVGHEVAAIREAALAQAEARYRPSHLYGDGRAGERIAGILAGDVGERAA